MMVEDEGINTDLKFSFPNNSQTGNDKPPDTILSPTKSEALTTTPLLPVESTSTSTLYTDKKNHSMQSRNSLTYTQVSQTTIPTFPSTQGLVNDEEFDSIIESVREAIRNGIHPIRIRQGSSGSYFARNKMGKIVGVFKPKNEEPYGHLNPKWTKWLHKTCLPCCFGRGCLIPNLGYISEAAASLLDRKLGLDMVPRTEVVELSSSSFHYSWIDKRNANKKGLCPKIGSFQIFLSGYRDASVLIRDFLDPSLPPSIQTQFQLCFERLVILDYLMRNTDRGMDNWMLFYGRIEDDETEEKIAASQSSISSWQVVSPQVARIAAIDNGLAFPFKHPDNWRSYPFGWAWLPCTKIPFSEETRSLFLPKLTDPRFVDELCFELKKVFMIDADFDEKLFIKQMALLRGQLQNLVEALELGQSPYELVRKPLIMILPIEDEHDELHQAEEGIVNDDEYQYYQQKHRDSHPFTSAAIKQKWRKIMIQVKPFFSWC